MPALAFASGELYYQEQHIRETKRSSYSPPVAEWSKHTAKLPGGRVYELPSS